MDAHIQCRDKSGQWALSYRFCVCCWKYSTLPSSSTAVCSIRPWPFDSSCPGFPTWSVASMLNRLISHILRGGCLCARACVVACACACMCACAVCTCVHVCVCKHVLVYAFIHANTCTFTRGQKHTYAQEDCDVLHQYLFTHTQYCVHH